MSKNGTPGLLVVIEGIDGGGKTTLQRSLAAALRKNGHDVVETKEPTDGPLGQEIRAIAASGRDQISPEKEFELFHEDRHQHVKSLVRPALDRGDIVIQDRSYFSTVAYQGERGLDRTDLLEKSIQIAPKPDVLLIVDLPAEVALERIRTLRKQATDDFEKLGALSRIREVFQEFTGSHVLDGRLEPERIHEQALGIIQTQIREK